MNKKQSQFHFSDTCHFAHINNYIIYSPKKSTFVGKTTTDGPCSVLASRIHIIYNKSCYRIPTLSIMINFILSSMITFIYQNWDFLRCDLLLRIDISIIPMIMCFEKI